MSAEQDLPCGRQTGLANGRFEIAAGEHVHESGAGERVARPVDRGERARDGRYRDACTSLAVLHEQRRGTRRSARRGAHRARRAGWRARRARRPRRGRSGPLPRDGCRTAARSARVVRRTGTPCRERPPSRREAPRRAGRSRRTSERARRGVRRGSRPTGWRRARAPPVRRSPRAVRTAAADRVSTMSVSASPTWSSPQRIVHGGVTAARPYPARSSGAAVDALVPQRGAEPFPVGVVAERRHQHHVPLGARQGCAHGGGPSARRWPRRRPRGAPVEPGSRRGGRARAADGRARRRAARRPARGAAVGGRAGEGPDTAMTSASASAMALVVGAPVDGERKRPRRRRGRGEALAECRPDASGTCGVAGANAAVAGTSLPRATMNGPPLPDRDP